MSLLRRFSLPRLSRARASYASGSRRRARTGRGHTRLRRSGRPPMFGT